jgi:hypothetical protein
MARDVWIERRYAPDRARQLRALLLVLAHPGAPVSDARTLAHPPRGANPDVPRGVA